MGVKIQDITSKSAKIASTDLIEIAQVSGPSYVSRKVTGAEINELSLDTTPQLGGNLDVNGNSIVSTSNGNINITPNGNGAVVIGGNSTQATELRFMEDSDNGTNYVALKANNTLAANTTYTLPTADGTNGQVLQTNGSGTLSWFGAKKYVALLSQTSGTSAPTISVLENTIGTLVWSRVSDGVYQATLTSAFPNDNKTFLTIANNLQNLGGVNYITWFDGSTIQVDTLDSSFTNSDGLLSLTAIEIKVYP